MQKSHSLLHSAAPFKLAALIHLKFLSQLLLGSYFLLPQLPLIIVSGVVTSLQTQSILITWCDLILLGFPIWVILKYLFL